MRSYGHERMGAVIVADLTVKPEPLDELVRTLQTQETGMDEVLDDLARDVAILAGRWTGVAQDAYSQSQQMWLHRMRVQVEVLNHATVALQQAVEGYRQADDEVGQLWSL